MTTSVSRRLNILCTRSVWRYKRSNQNS